MTVDDPVYVEVCAGVGGLSLGLELAGWRPVVFVENKPFCQQILRRHFPEVPCLDDLTDPNIGQWITEALPPGLREPGRVDLLCGGIPCQPVSHAGRRKGAADDRFLWPYFLGLVRLLRPRFVLVENVYGLVTAGEGVVLEGILTDLEGESYEVAPPVVFPAAAVGAPHRRDRVWICAYARHDGRVGAADEHEQEEWTGQSEGVRRFEGWAGRETDAHSQGQRTGGLHSGQGEGRGGEGDSPGPSSSDESGLPADSYSHELWLRQQLQGERGAAGREPGESGDDGASGDAVHSDGEGRTDSGTRLVGVRELPDQRHPRLGTTPGGEADAQEPGHGHGDAADASSPGLEVWNGLQYSGPRSRALTAIASPEWWAIEPAVGRVVDGSPGRVGELEGLGNAVVPQQAWRVGAALLTSYRAMADA